MHIWYELWYRLASATRMISSSFMWYKCSPNVIERRPERLSPNLLKSSRRCDLTPLELSGYLIYLNFGAVLG